MKIEKEQLKVRLESRLQDINTNDQSLMEKSAFFEKENMNLKKKLIGLQKELNMEKEEQGAMIEQLQVSFCIILYIVNKLIYFTIFLSIYLFY